MSLTIPANPAAGLMHDVIVSVVTIDGVRMISAYNVIRLTNRRQRINPRTYWTRMVNEHPELAQGVKSYRISRAAQGASPVLDAKRVVTLLNVIPGETAANFRLLSADILVRYLGGDDTLVAGIKKNAEAPDDASDGNPAHLSVVDAKRQRESDDDEMSSVTRDVRMRIATIQEATDFLIRIHSPIDEPTKLCIRDMILNALAPLSSVTHGGGIR